MALQQRRHPAYPSMLLKKLRHRFLLMVRWIGLQPFDKVILRVLGDSGPSAFRPFVPSSLEGKRGEYADQIGSTRFSPPASPGSANRCSARSPLSSGCNRNTPHGRPSPRYLAPADRHSSAHPEVPSPMLPALLVVSPSSFVLPWKVPRFEG